MITTTCATTSQKKFPPKRKRKLQPTFLYWRDFAKILKLKHKNVRMRCDFHDFSIGKIQNELLIAKIWLNLL